MSNPQTPFDKNVLTRAGIAGLVLAGLGVGLFILVWIVLGEAGVADFPRLFASLCVPPAVIAAIVGGYMLVVRPGEDAQQPRAAQREETAPPPAEDSAE